MTECLDCGYPALRQEGHAEWCDRPIRKVCRYVGLRPEAPHGHRQRCQDCREWDARDRRFNL